MPQSVKTSYKDLVNETRIPIWNFVGLAIIGIMVGYGSYASGVTAKQEEAFLNNPVQGDLYEVKVDQNYTTFRIEAVSGDSLLVAWNAYAVTKATGLTSIEKDENYDETVMIPRSELSDMKKANNIYHIYRKSRLQ
ncbi:hypothetical protein WBG78_22635 [Chryseolinea sp. T2]|uniref:hypothetical protein n=1 Tax=Chryseolinea sp. T2 TaxID=3129255 RepID=UPI003078312C